MTALQKSFLYDPNLLFKDAGLVAASAAAQVGGSAKVVDLGLGRFDGRMIIDASAIEVDTGNEVYDIIVQLSNSKTFASGIVNGPSYKVGDSSVTAQSADSVAGRFELPFHNEIQGTLYRYARVYTIVAGTIATGINYTAFAVAKA